FFFSSRRRHTRFSRDWSSDVCSSDLGFSGLVNAPTGSGKTYSLMVPIVTDFMERHPTEKARKNAGLHAVWITPIRALSKEIELRSEERRVGKESRSRWSRGQHKIKGW